VKILKEKKLDTDMYPGDSLVLLIGNKKILEHRCTEQRHFVKAILFETEDMIGAALMFDDNS